jgi:8-oxo-dGTP diphosphatase
MIRLFVYFRLMTEKNFKYCITCGGKLSLQRVEDRSRLVCLMCGEIHYENPVPCAAALVRNKSGEILLVKRGIEPARGSWALPSGFVEIDETPQGACLRELKEETGLGGRILRLLGVYSQESPMYKQVLIIGYEVEAEGIPSPGSDSIEVGYFSPDKIADIAFPSHREMIADAMRARLE